VRVEAKQERNCRPPRVLDKIALLLLLLLIPNVSWAGDDQVSVIDVKGSPRLMKANSVWLGDCETGAAIDDGDRIFTGEGDAVDLRFGSEEMNILRIEKDSDVAIAKKTDPVSVLLASGRLMAKIKKLPKGSSFEVRTPVAICGARGTGWFVETDSNKSAFGVFENSIYVKGIDRSGNIIEDELSLTEGQKTLIDRFDKPGAIEKLSEADLNKWNDLIKELEPNDIKQRPKPTIEQREELNIDLDKQAELLQTKLDKMNKIDAMETRIGVVGEGALTGPGGASGRSMLGPDDDKKERDGSQLETINR